MRAQTLLLALIAGGAIPAAAAQQAQTPLPSAIPQSFTECAAEFRRTSGNDGSPPPPPFECTRVYFGDLHPGSTYELAAAGGRAVAVGDRYIDDVLRPAIATRLAQRSSGAGGKRRLNAFIRLARTAGTARCALVQEIWSGGTLRVAFASSCAVQNRDALIEDLLRIEEDLLPR